MGFLQVLYFVRTCGRWQGHIFFSASRCPCGHGRGEARTGQSFFVPLFVDTFTCQDVAERCARGVFGSPYQRAQPATNGGFLVRAIKTNGSVRPAGHRWTRPTKVTKAAVTFWWSLGHKPTMCCMEYQHRIVKHEPKMTILSYEIFDGKCEWIEEHWFAGNHGCVIPNNLGISCWNVLKTLPGRCSWIHYNKHPKYPK